jgi:hypothetical protein
MNKVIDLPKPPNRNSQSTHPSYSLNHGLRHINRSSLSPKACPHNNTYILPFLVRINYFLVILLSRRSENLGYRFAVSSLNRARITLHIFDPILYLPVLSFKAPSKPYSCVFLRKKRALFCTPIRNSIFVKDSSKGVVT